MKNFYADWKFHPGCLAETSADFMRNSACVENEVYISARAKSWMKKSKWQHQSKSNSCSYYFLQSTILLSLNLQLYGVILIFKVHQAKTSIWLYIYHTKKIVWEAKFFRLHQSNRKKKFIMGSFCRKNG